MSDHIDKLVGQLRALARPGIEVERDGERLVFQVVTRTPPREVLWRCSGALQVPLDQAARQVLQAFDAFNDRAATLVAEGRAHGLSPAEISQGIFAQAVMMNPHDLTDVLALNVDSVETDEQRWQRA
jgi:hypothetical protein